MAVWLVWGCLLGLTLVLHRRLGSLRESILASGCVIGVFVAVSTEVLSLLHAVHFGGVLAGWAAMSITLVALHWRVPRRPPTTRIPVPLAPSERLLLIGVGLIVMVVGLVAVTAPPNTWDSMTYHMSRVMHWIAAGSVAHYPTHILRQLYLAPWAEFAILHLQVLSGSDRWANCVQWLAMIGSLAGVSLIARHLGADTRGQILAIVMAATLPAGVLQANGTQNSYVLTFWLVCLARYLLAWHQHRSLESAAGAAAAAALAIMTKGTAYVLAAPLVLWFGFAALITPRRRGAVALATMVGMTVAVNAGHWWRNWGLFRHPLAPPLELHLYRNEAFSPSFLISTLVRNLSLQLTTPSLRINELVTAAVGGVHEWLGLDPSDPRVTFPACVFTVEGYVLHEDLAGNPLQLLIIAAALGSLVLRPSVPQRGVLLAYGACLIAALVLFCLLFKWQPWHTRLHLPLFVLSAPLVGALTPPRLVKRSGFSAVNLVAALLLVTGVYAAAMNRSRPILGRRNVFTLPRAEQYFANNRQLRQPYQQALSLLVERRCKTIGLVCGPDHWEYPLWALARDQGMTDVRIRHVHAAWRMPGEAPLGESPVQAIVLLDGQRGAEVREQNPGLVEEHIYGPITVFTEPRPRPPVAGGTSTIVERKMNASP